MNEPFPLLPGMMLARPSLAVKGKSCGFAPLTLDSARSWRKFNGQKGKMFFTRSATTLGSCCRLIAERIEV